MNITVEATFENGTFKLAEQIGLPEGARVQLTITNLGADPLADVIGICDSSRADSLAERHDEVIYDHTPAGPRP